jgi:uncharacterized membrane protein
MKNHSIFRFVIDIILLIVLFLLLVSPLLLTFTLKVSDMDLKAATINRVAGASSQRDY